jgi:hypothetical protein
MSDKISSWGTLRLLPENIYYAKRQLTTNLKREPTSEELANHLQMSQKKLSDILKTETMETETYTENSLSPSFKRTNKYFGSPLQTTTHKHSPYSNPNRYEEGGKKRQRHYKKRKYSKKYKKSKTRCKSISCKSISCKSISCKSSKKSKCMKKYV